MKTLSDLEIDLTALSEARDVMTRIYEATEYDRFRQAARWLEKLRCELREEEPRLGACDVVAQNAKVILAMCMAILPNMSDGALYVKEATEKIRKVFPDIFPGTA